MWLVASRIGRSRGTILQRGVYDVSMVYAQSMRLGAEFGTVVSLVDVTRNHEIARLKDAFLGSVSHELRTPLTNICAFTEILTQLTPDNEKDWQEFLAIVSTETNRLKGMVEDLLEHSRLHTGQVEWRCAPVDLGQQVGIAAGLFAEQAASRKIELVWVPPRVICTAQADRERLHRSHLPARRRASLFGPRAPAALAARFHVDQSRRASRTIRAPCLRRVTPRPPKRPRGSTDGTLRQLVRRNPPRNTTGTARQPGEQCAMKER